MTDAEKRAERLIRRVLAFVEAEKRRDPYDFLNVNLDEVPRPLTRQQRKALSIATFGHDVMEPRPQRRMLSRAELAERARELFGDDR